MKKGRKWMTALLAIVALCSILAACSKKTPTPTELEYGDVDLSSETAAGLESMAQYRTRFKNGDVNIGDVMPYYHDGIYSFFYLAETSNHPVYRVDTTDFVHYEDKGEALSPGASNAQDAMIGTGSIVEADGDYYFFYTGFKKDNPEAVMVARSVGNIDRFEKVSDFMFTAASVDGCDLEGWDFRDPEAVYDRENGQFVLFLSARKGGEPVIAEFRVSLDLSSVTYGGVVYSDTQFGANVLECCDVFPMGDKWYLTYSVQDTSNGGNDGENAVEAAVGSRGKVFYAVADRLDGPFVQYADAALDSHAFYAAKSIQDGTNTYLAGWIRQKNSNIGWQYLWGGNLLVHQLLQNPDGSLSVALPQSVRNHYSVERKLDSALEAYNGFDMIAESKDYHIIGGEYSSYLLHTTATFDSDVSEFGFALGVSSNTANIIEVAFVPHADKMRSAMAGQQELCAKNIRLTPGETYDITLLVEGSTVTVYVNNSVAFTSRIRNIGNKKLAVYALGGSVTMQDFHLYTPSGYADTLAAGYGNLTVTERGAEQKGSVNTLAVAPDAPATLRYTLDADNFVRCTAAVYAQTAVRAAIKLGGNTLGEYVAEANTVLQVRADTLAYKGDALTVELTADTAVDVWTNVSFETDKRPFAAAVKAETADDGTVGYTAGASGVYEYVATMYYGGAIDGDPMFEVGDGARAPISEAARLVTLRGAVRLQAGETLAAALGYGKFPASIGAHSIVLQICGGGSTDTFAAGVGTYTAPVPTPCNITAETVPTFAGVEFTGEREMSVEMNGHVFGEQGKNGFVYAYGKAGDELKPMTEYNTNGEVWEYKHKAPEASDALEIKADYMKQGGGYVTAVVWVAPADGYIDFVADYESHSENVQVQVLRNRTLLRDVFLKEAGRTDITLTGIEVKGGDTVALAVRAAGRAMGESDGNYHLRIGKGNSSVPFDPTAPPIADHAADYNVDRQGDYGWQYLDVGYVWGDNEHPGDAAELEKSAYGWGNSGKGIDVSGTIHGEATVAWCNLSGGTLAVGVSGTVTGNAYIRMWVLRADGSYEKVTDGKVNGTFALPNKGFVLQPNDRIAVMFFDNNGAGCTLSMQVRSTDEIEIRGTALAAELTKAKAIGNDDGRYTPDSFDRLTTAITDAENFVRDMADTRKTYVEVAAAVRALKDAVSGLQLDTSAARAELDAAIASAAAIEGKPLLGDAAAFAAALAQAKDVAAQANATSETLTAATAALVAAMRGVTVKVADFAADFSDGQGDNGWAFYRIAPTNWDDYNAGGARVELKYSDGAYKDGETTVGVELWKTSGATVAYRNYSAAAHTYALRGQIEYIGDGEEACVAYVILRADGRYEHIANWNTYRVGAAHTIDKEFTLQAGDAVLLVLRDVGGAATDSKLTLQIGCNDALTVDKSRLQALADEAGEKNADDYTAESFAALAAAKTVAQSVLDKAEPTAGEVYRAESALRRAIERLEPQNAVTSTTQADVLNGSGLWTVYRSGITWNPARLLFDTMLAYNEDNGNLKLGDGESVTGADGALVLSSDNSGIALVFQAQTAGTYRLTANYTGDSKTNGRVFAGAGNELSERKWIGTAESFDDTIELRAGEYIAIHFENFSDGHGLASAVLTFTLALQPAA